MVIKVQLPRFFETSYTSQAQTYSYISQITHKTGVQFVKLGYLPEPKRACFTLCAPAKELNYNASSTYGHTHLASSHN